MKVAQIIKNTIQGIFAAGFVVQLIFGFFAYFVTSQNKSTGAYYDGLGRLLSASPSFMRLIFGEERLWAGWSWFVVEMVVFWGWMGLWVFSNTLLEKNPGK
ncbi:MAG: hypothetical protein WBV94_03930 [Blastocatellia bacterium]